MTFETWFHSLHPNIPVTGAVSVLKLSAEGATLPFIARYRKEQTGNLDEVAIQAALDAKEQWEGLINRQGFIVSEIEKQGKLTPELKDQILGCFQPDLLEDLYLPYKQKRKTKATLAREAGLEPLAEWIWNVGHGTEVPLPGQSLEIWAFTFRNDDKGFKDAQSAIDGASDILIERITEKQELRQAVRAAVMERGEVRTGKGPKAKPHSKFENYFSFHEPVTSLIKPQNSHRYLALRRGWMEEELTLNIGGATPETDDAFFAPLLQAYEVEALSVHDSAVAPTLKKIARLSLKAHVLPSIENEAHKALKDIADAAAIKVFADNVRKLMLASPFGPKAVLGVDPGLRTGCKVAVVDASGRHVANTVMHLQSADQKAKAKVLLAEVVKNAGIRAIAVGNGTAGRETEIFLRQAMKELTLETPVVMVNEAGASVYSASEVARTEFPELDVTVRGAISIARRLQDPLAELVKIDPKSIGVGQYQHDVSQPALKRSLDLVVDLCVNSVGVNLNTASEHLLAHVSGIGPGLAKAIVTHRGSKGLFKSRAELTEVPRFSTKAFEQAAGFLRIPDGVHPLDNTGVHPERYPVLENHARKLGKELSALMGSEGVALLRKDKELGAELGKFTAEDIVRELEKPGRDPRDAFVPFSFRDDIHEVKDLKQGMLCPGVVTNVTNFGAFVDIGVHQDGLVHISQISDKYIKEPSEAVSPGDHVKVRVLDVNFEKNQIALSMKGTGAKATAEPGEKAEKREKRARGGDGARSGKPKREPRPAPPKQPLKVPTGPPPVLLGAPKAQPQVRIQAQQQRSAVPPKEQFKNNPFAALAGLKIGKS